MTVQLAKSRQHEYIGNANVQAVEAMYSMLENELEDKSRKFDDAALAVFKATSEAYRSEDIKGASMDESLKRMRQKLHAI